MTHTDLHLHSYYSDGAEPPSVVVQRAAERRYELISLTDHDGIGGLGEAAKAAKKFGIAFIPGIELSSKMTARLGDFPENTYYMHILGYGIDPGNPRLLEKCEEIMKLRYMRNDELRDAFAAKGIDVDMEEVRKDASAAFIGKANFARVFIKMGLCKSVEEAFEDPNLLNDPKIRAIRKDKMDAKEAISLIREAGGRAFLAHPFQLSYTDAKNDSPEVYLEKLGLCIEYMKSLGMEGLECAYPTHSREQRDYLIEKAKSLGLLVSRGSDDHGEGIRRVKHMGDFEADIEDKYLAWAAKIAE